MDIESFNLLLKFPFMPGGECSLGLVCLIWFFVLCAIICSESVCEKVPRYNSIVRGIESASVSPKCIVLFILNTALCTYLSGYLLTLPAKVLDSFLKAFSRFSVDPWYLAQIETGLLQEDPFRPHNWLRKLHVKPYLCSILLLFISLNIS